MEASERDDPARAKRTARANRKEERERWTLRVAVVGAIVAVISFAWSCETAQDQGDFQDAVEERSSAPVLAAGVEPQNRLGEISVKTALGTAPKPRQVPEIRQRHRIARLIVPVWNIGLGVAVIRGHPLLGDCRAAERKIRQSSPPKRRAGYYNVPSGKSEQLVFPVSQHDVTEISTLRRRGDDSVYLLTVTLRYTDPLVRRDRWTCISWIRSSPDNSWTLSTQDYDDREFPE
jgi:hypothetical protein